MEKQSKFLVIVIIVLSILVGVLGSFIIFDKYTRDNNDVNEIKDEDNDKNEETNNEVNDSDNQKYLGTYTVKFNENYEGKGAAPSSLTLNSDGTFLFGWNICHAITGVVGNYNIVDNKIVLSNLATKYEPDQSTLDFNLDGKTTLEFVIVSENEIYLDFDKEMFGCTITGSQNGSFVK